MFWIQKSFKLIILDGDVVFQACVRAWSTRAARVIWVAVMRDKYGILALIAQTSFRRGPSGGAAKRRLFSQAIVFTALGTWSVRSYNQITTELELSESIWAKGNEK